MTNKKHPATSCTTMRPRRMRSFLLSAPAAFAVVAWLALSADAQVGAITRPASELFGISEGLILEGAGVNVSTGNFIRSDVDLRVGALVISRSYNAQDDRVRSLGPGWSPPFQAGLTRQQDDSVVLDGDDGRTFRIPRVGSGYGRAHGLHADLVETEGGRHALTFLNGEVWHFDSAGHVERIAREGTSLEIFRDPAARVTSVVESTGNRVDLSYDTTGRISGLASSDGQRVTYAYSETGELTGVTAPDGTTTTFLYADGRLSQVIDGEARTVVTNSYDAQGRIQTQTASDGETVEFAYADDTTTATRSPGDVAVSYRHDALGQVIRIDDPGADRIEREFDAAGRLSAQTSRSGMTTRLTYDARGNLIGRNLGGVESSWQYDALDRMVQINGPTGDVTQLQYTGASRIPTVVIDPAGVRMNYSIADGAIQAVTDATGARTEYGYDSFRRVVSVTDPLGRTTGLAYDAAGRLASITTPANRTTRFERDAAGRATRILDPSGAAVRYRYSLSGQLLARVDEVGAERTYTYDSAGRQSASMDALGAVTSYAYASGGNLASVVDANGARASFRYDNRGRLIELESVIGQFVRYEYDAERRESVRIAASGTSSSQYDERGNLVSSTDAEGRVTRYAYDNANRLIEVTDPTGARWRTSYDLAGRVSSRTDPMGATTKYEYDSMGRLAATIDVLNRRTDYGYDAAGQLVKLIDAAHGITLYTYDSDGHVTSVTTPAGLVTSFEYDGAGRRVAMVDARGGVTRFEYSARGDLTATIAPSGARHQLEYDLAGRVVAAIDPNGYRTEYGYDAAGNLLTLTDANGGVYAYTYNAANQQTSSTDPLGRTTTQEYDAAGNLIAVTDPDDQTITMFYDGVGNLLMRSGADGAETLFEYDDADRVVSTIDALGMATYQRDAMGRITEVSEPDGDTYEMEYDAARRQVGLTYPSGREVRYGFDALDRLIRTSTAGRWDADYTLDPDGRLLQEDLPNGWTRRYAYDGGLLSSYRESRSGHRIDDMDLHRDADGRLVKERSDGRVTRYAYDAAGQLTKVSAQRGRVWSASYDAVGNRSVIKDEHGVTHFTYDAAHQLIGEQTGHSRTHYRYDGAGRLVERSGGRGRLEIEYDGLGRPVSHTLGTGHVTIERTSTFRSDGLVGELQTRKFFGGHPVDEQKVVYEWSTAGGTAQVLAQYGEYDAEFVYGYGRISAHTGHQAAVFSRDVRGSARRTPSTAAWVEAEAYDILGAALPPNTEDPGELPRFGFQGELSWDGFVNLRARTYDSGVGRFLSRDPVSTRIGAVAASSAYAYANNDPVNLIDPLGKAAMPGAAAAVAPFLLRGIGSAGGSGGGILGASLGAVLPQLAAAIVRNVPAAYPIECPGPSDSPESQDKCFQGVLLRARGFIREDCLNADPNCLDDLWNSRQPERAAQSVAINELNKRREGWWDRFYDDQLGGGTTLSVDVDWEVRPGLLTNPQDCLGQAFDTCNYRVDIVTQGSGEADNIFEVKRYEGPDTTSEVTAQLRRYMITAWTEDRVLFEPGTELQNWASSFQVNDDWHDHLFGSDTVWVWGLHLPDGHVYCKRFTEPICQRAPTCASRLGRGHAAGTVKEPKGAPSSAGRSLARVAAQWLGASSR